MKPATILVKFVVFASIVGFLAGSQTQGEEKRTVEGLLYDLKHPEAEKRREAARILGDNKIREAVPDLIPLTKDPEAAVRLEAAKALLRIRDTRALECFIDLTRQPEIEIQKIAIQGIVDIYAIEEGGGFVDGVKTVVDFLNPLSDDYDPLVVESYVPVSENAVTAISDLLFSEDRGVREDAAFALGVLRGRSALPVIEDVIEREESNSVKVELIRAVYKIGDSKGGEIIVPLIRDPDKKTHDEAILTAGRLRVQSAVAPLNEFYRAGIEERKKLFGVVPVSGSDDLQRKILEALSYIGDASSKDIFEDALEDERTHYRRFGAEGLGRVGDTAYVELLARKRLRVDSKNVQMAMSYALFLLGREEHIIEMVDNVGDSQVYYYLLELAPEKTSLLYPYVQTEKDSIKIRLLDVIGMTGDSTALPIVQEMTGHENADVISAANLAIRRLQARVP
jgi:HEAT repeat protein